MGEILRYEPLCPGTYETIPVKEYKNKIDEKVTMKGPGVFSMVNGTSITRGRNDSRVSIKEGPWVINTHRALDLANIKKHFVSST